MESPMDNLNNIIFSYYVGEFLKIRRQILNFALIFFLITLYNFCIPSKNTRGH
jgi:hypothetical protein